MHTFNVYFPVQSNRERCNLANARSRESIIQYSRPQIRRLETGAFVLLGCFAFWFLVTQIAHRGAAPAAHSRFSISAHFDNIGGLRLGARVSMSGVEIGRVVRIMLEPKQNQATVLLQISGKFNAIPKDSAASIVTQGVLGGQSISMTAGIANAYLSEGDVIQTTRSAFVLEKSIGRLIAH